MELITLQSIPIVGSLLPPTGINQPNDYLHGSLQGNVHGIISHQPTKKGILNLQQIRLNSTDVKQIPKMGHENQPLL